MDNTKVNKKHKHELHPFDIWPPPPDKKDLDNKARHKPRNPTYVDPNKHLEHTDAPVYDASEPEPTETEDKKEDKEEQDNR